MTSLETSLITFGFLAGGASLGMWAQYRLPQHHLSKASQDSVKLAAGMVGTMSALILGLLVSSSKNSFDAVNTSIAQTGVKIIQLDHLLADYGPEAAELRGQLRASVSNQIGKIWPAEKQLSAGLGAIEKSTAIQDFQTRLLGLAPKTDLQKSLLVQAQQVSNDLSQNHLLLIEQQQEGMPATLIVLLVFWLTLLFVSFGLFTPYNVTTFTALCICAASVSSAIFLILEMSHPLDGLIRVSSSPLVKALQLIGH